MTKRKKSAEKTGNSDSKTSQRGAEEPSLEELEEAEQDARDPTHEKEIPAQ